MVNFFIMDFSLFEAQKFTSAVKYIDTGLAEGRADAGIVLCNVIAVTATTIVLLINYGSMNFETIPCKI